MDDRKSVLRRHAALMDRMATTLGVDLEEAVLDSRLPFDTIADAVLRCRDCSRPEACETWLETAPEAEGQAGVAPGYCRNKSLLDRLAGGEAP